MSGPLFFSSGDLLADRRYDYARALLEENDQAAASDLLVQALERAPAFAAAWFLLGELHERAGKTAEAVDAFGQAVAADPADRHGAALRLARLGSADTATMPAGYVRALFDQYAERFDRALTEDLHYRGPQLLFDAVLATAADASRALRFERALDLGCGTGLVGAAFEANIGVLEGVDLSPRMAAWAARRGCYAHVEVADMTTSLRSRPDGSHDLVMAGDALVYVRELAPLFSEVGRILALSGLFAATLETHAGPGVMLGPTLRYAHEPDYVRNALMSAGLRALRFEHVSTRDESGLPVPGLLFVAERSSRECRE